jgi:hypothetical protein
MKTKHKYTDANFINLFDEDNTAIAVSLDQENRGIIEWVSGSSFGYRGDLKGSNVSILITAPVSYYH